MSSTETNDALPREEPTTDLLGGLVSDAKDLVLAHGEHVKLEVRDELRALKDAVKRIAIALGVVVIGGLLAAHAIALAIAAVTGSPVWLGYAVLAVIAGVVGYVVLRTKPDNKQIDLVPEDAIADAKRDVKRVADAITH
jgi:hypothetical protein